ncbi:MAG: lysophospholipid acyltransferase family protein [Ktedonobacterales bacterium]
MSASQPPVRQVAPQPSSPRRVWRALRTPHATERPPGVPKLRYHFPMPWLMHMGRDMLRGTPRSFRADCELAVRILPRRPTLEGIEQIPARGSFILVANHYQRRDLWIGWEGALLCHALWQAQPELVCHVITTDRAVLDGATVRFSRWAFARVARVWDFVLVTPPEARDADADQSRRHALRACLRRLKRPDGRPVCLCVFPEGMSGSTRGLGAPTPGTGRSLLALAATGVPLLPAAVWENEDGALHARFGPVWNPSPPAGLARSALDRWSADEALSRVAALLPESLRGVYATTPDESL